MVSTPMKQANPIHIFFMMVFGVRFLFVLLFLLCFSFSFISVCKSFNLAQSYIKRFNNADKKT